MQTALCIIDFSLLQKILTWLSGLKALKQDSDF